MHHASNEKYLNKNYGDLFVFWDKLFGTFQQEEEKPVYGLTHPLKSQSFIWQHFHYYLEMFAALKSESTLYRKWKIVFGPPELLDQDIRPRLEKKILPTSNRAALTKRFRVYLIGQLILSVLVLVVVTYFFPLLNWIEKSTGLVIILITLINCCALLEKRKWIFHLEYIRLTVLVAYLSYWLNSPLFFLPALAMILLFVSTESVRKWYFEFVYSNSEQYQDSNVSH